MTSDLFIKGLSSEDGNKTVELLVQKSASNSSDISNLRVFDNKEISSNGMYGLTKEISFTSTSSSIETRGRIIVLIDDQKSIGYTTLILADQKIWEKNADMWQKIQSSIKSGN